MRIISVFKRKSISLLFLCFIILLVLFSTSSFTATKSGLKLWANNVVPSLFPFLIAVELLKHTNVVYYLSVYLDKYMRPLFNLPGISSFPFVMGVLSGYPVGAKIVSDLYANRACTKDEAERMLPFTNNSGPLFIIGTVGISFYSNSTMGVILLVSHILSAITVGVITGLFSRLNHSVKHIESNYAVTPNKDISFSELGEIISSSIITSVKTIIMIGGFVTLFSVIITLLEKTKLIVLFGNIFGNLLGIDSSIISSFLTGIVEFTNGLSSLSQIHIKHISTNIILSAFLLSFGGISITLQVLSIISKHNLSIKKYVVGKVLQGIIAAVYTLLALKISIFNFNL